ncbi:hypothetical protein RchiOBHm_Chr1g0323121 [Rosa chinensis]|uniref:Uncharacterized protein n=1 Tax=Rosa chinensis TaxID=74649 RepID=A0A2P6S9H8_ROSCH|nr:hypothetical protein RchiOBHm_Chr1g0323121 [Rosa chinensis]
MEEMKIVSFQLGKLLFIPKWKFLPMAITSSYELRFSRSTYPRTRIDALYNFCEGSFRRIPTYKKSTFSNPLKPYFSNKNSSETLPLRPQATKSSNCYKINSGKSSENNYEFPGHHNSALLKNSNKLTRISFLQTMMGAF